MATNNLIKTAIGVTVGIILIVGLIWPTIESYSDERSVSFNNGNPGASPYLVATEPLDFEISITVGDSTFTKDGNTYTAPTFRGTFVATPDFSVGYVYSADGSTSDLLMPGETMASLAAGSTITITSSDTGITVNYGGTVKSFDFNRYIVHIDPNGNYKQFKASDTTALYLNSINQLYVSTSINTNSLGFAWANGLVGQIAGTDVTLSLDTSEVTGYADLIRADLSTYYFDDSLGTNSDNSNFRSYYVFAPMTVSAFTDADDHNVSMLMIVGLMVVLLLVVMVARNLNMRG